MNRSVEAVSPPSDLHLTPHLIEQLAVDAHYAHADALAEQLRSLANANIRSEAEIPEVIVRMGEERAYLFAQALANLLFGAIGLVGRLFQAIRSILFRDAGVTRGQLLQPLGSIRTMAEILRDNPALAPDERARMLAIIVDQSDRFDRVVGGSLKVPSGV